MVPKRKPIERSTLNFANWLTSVWWLNAPKIVWINWFRGGGSQHTGNIRFWDTLPFFSMRSSIDRMGKPFRNPIAQKTRSGVWKNHLGVALIPNHGTWSKITKHPRCFDPEWHIKTANMIYSFSLLVKYVAPLQYWCPLSLFHEGITASQFRRISKRLRAILALFFVEGHVV